MLFDGADALLQPLDSFVELAVRKVDQRTRFLKLFVEIGAIVRMTPLNVHLETFGDELEFVAEPFHQHAAMSLGLLDAVAQA